MRKVALAAVCLLACAPAWAAKFVGVTVHWTAPTTNTDGTPCTDLAGFDIYYGPNPSALTQRVKLPNPAQASYRFSTLPSGAVYFVVTSYTTSGTQSQPSNVVEYVPPPTLGQPVQLP